MKFCGVLPHETLTWRDHINNIDKTKNIWLMCLPISNRYFKKCTYPFPTNGSFLYPLKTSENRKAKHLSHKSKYKISNRDPSLSNQVLSSAEKELQKRLYLK